jgi:hypothetical protein
VDRSNVLGAHLSRPFEWRNLADGVAVRLANDRGDQLTGLAAVADQREEPEVLLVADDAPPSPMSTFLCPAVRVRRPIRVGLE